MSTSTPLDFKVLEIFIVASTDAIVIQIVASAMYRPTQILHHGNHKQFKDIGAIEKYLLPKPKAKIDPIPSNFPLALRCLSGMN
jgi:hypothetical protein